MSIEGPSSMDQAVKAPVDQLFNLVEQAQSTNSWRGPGNLALRNALRNTPKVKKSISQILKSSDYDPETKIKKMLETIGLYNITLNQELKGKFQSAIDQASSPTKPQAQDQIQSSTALTPTPASTTAPAPAPASTPASTSAAPAPATPQWIFIDKTNTGKLVYVNVKKDPTLTDVKIKDTVLEFNKCLFFLHQILEYLRRNALTESLAGINKNYLQVKVFFDEIIKETDGPPPDEDQPLALTTNLITENAEKLAAAATDAQTLIDNILDKLHKQAQKQTTPATTLAIATANRVKKEADLLQHLSTKIKRTVQPASGGGAEEVKEPDFQDQLKRAKAAQTEAMQAERVQAEAIPQLKEQAKALVQQAEESIKQTTAMLEELKTLKASIVGKNFKKENVTKIDEAVAKFNGTVSVITELDQQISKLFETVKTSTYQQIDPLIQEIAGLLEEMKTKVVEAEKFLNVGVKLSIHQAQESIQKAQTSSFLVASSSSSAAAAAPASALTTTPPPATTPPLDQLRPSSSSSSPDASSSSSSSSSPLLLPSPTSDQHQDQAQAQAQAQHQAPSLSMGTYMLGIAALVLSVMSAGIQ